MEWVKVTDRNPEKMGDYLTRNKSNFYHVCYFSGAGTWLRKDNRETKNHLKITHWCKIIEPKTASEGVE